MLIEDTYMLPSGMVCCPPKTLPALFSYARTEYYRSKSFSGVFMREINDLFSHIAHEVYGSVFIWSEYNRGQWAKFVDSRASGLDGGACMFSCEAEGDCAVHKGTDFKGLNVGVPTGLFPYSLSLNSSKVLGLRAAIESFGKYSCDLIS